MKLSQLLEIPNPSNTETARGCRSCLNSDYNKCECAEQYKEYPKHINMNTHTFTVSTKKRNDRDEENNELIDLDEDEATELEEMYVETEASKYIQEGDIAVIKTGDVHASVDVTTI